MVAIGVNDDGYREIIGAAEGFTESAECWREFLSWLKSRGLRGVRMFIGDKAAGMVGALAEVFPEAAYQRCTVHFYRNALSKVPSSKKKAVAARLKAIHAQESFEACQEKALRVFRQAPFLFFITSYFRLSSRKSFGFRQGRAWPPQPTLGEAADC